jgi:hypothetical protein
MKQRNVVVVHGITAFVDARPDVQFAVTVPIVQVVAVDETRFL